MAGKPSDDDFMRMARESVMRMADSRGGSMPGNPPADASGALNDSRSQALRSQLEVSGGQSMGAGGKVGAEFREGDRFAKRFTIRGLIAQGGMGAVYRAMDESTDEVVALKTIRPDLVNSPEAVERFLAEGRVTRRLSHPGIARVFDIDRAEGRWFIAMEFVRGQTLRQWMRRKDAKGARISVKDALWAARKILDVLSYLHAQGIIHRDLKPENMIVGKADDGSGNFLKIIDFGLARSLAGNGPQLTATGAAMGTFAYMSPEQRAGKPLDQRTDIYSAAVIIYEMLTGVAYDGNWEGLSERRGDLPVAVQAELRRALSKFPDQRHRDANELIEALELAPLWSKPVDYGRDDGVKPPAAIPKPSIAAPKLAPTEQGFPIPPEVFTRKKKLASSLLSWSKDNLERTDSYRFRRQLIAGTFTVVAFVGFLLALVTKVSHKPGPFEIPNIVWWAIGVVASIFARGCAPTKKWEQETRQNFMRLALDSAAHLKAIEKVERGGNLEPDETARLLGLDSASAAYWALAEGERY